MNTQFTSMIPLTQARNTLGDLLKVTSKKKYVVLTKSGRPKAALVDIGYLTNLQNEVRKMYQKTYIDPTLLPFTRVFSDEEVRNWATIDATS